MPTLDAELSNGKCNGDVLALRHLRLAHTDQTSNMNATTPVAGVNAWFPHWSLPPLPLIVSEWAALIPLIIHLASVKGDHNLVGELALKGKLTLSLFPKLGHLLGVARLFSENPDFLTRASSKSDLSSTVWDIGWGSSFRCANGSARDYLTRLALTKCGPLIDLESGDGERRLTKPQVTNRRSSVTSVEDDDDDGGKEEEEVGDFRRYQTLYIIEMKKKKTVQDDERESKPSRATRLLWISWLSWPSWQSILHLIYFVALSVLTVVLVIYRAFGTAATVLLCMLTQIACLSVPVERPPGYLGNVEGQKTACMLSAIHENASTWYLYIGDRASIDWLLNKTMINITSKHRTVSRLYFRGAHFVQLLAMTYVAAQKNWDGVFLLCLLVLNAVFKLVTGFPAHQAALHWISKSGLKVRAHSLLVTGRVPMLGAIHLLSAKSGPTPGRSRPEHMRLEWMDEIIHPSVRRKVWGEKLASLPGRSADEEESLSSNDRDWVHNNLNWSQNFYDCIKEELEREWQ